MTCEFDQGTKLEECEDARKSLVGIMIQGAAGLAKFLTDKGGFKSGDVTSDDILDLAGRIGAAPIVYWRDDILRAATSGWEIWQDQTLDPHPLLDQQVWLFEKPWTIHSLREGGRTMDVLMSFIGSFREVKMVFLVLACHQPSADGRCQVAWFFTPILLESQTLYGRNLAELAAAMAFMKLRIASVERRLPPRHVRRQLERAGASAPDIRIVTLRRKENKEPGGSRDVQWSCQWIVGGHWRNQWYESRQEHEPVYIVPYLKGPKDKPLRVPRKVLYDLVK